MKYNIFTRSILLLFLTVCSTVAGIADTLQFVYVSDLHYGLNRTFRGRELTPAYMVNRAMIDEINRLPGIDFPSDGGVKAGKAVGATDYLIITGDITNRAQKNIQSAAASWRQFEKDWTGGRLTLKNEAGQPAPLLIAIGNHEASNAVGHYKVAVKDNTPCVAIYNMMMRPGRPLTRRTFDYDRDKINFSLTAKGVHLAFLQLWADSVERRWLDDDLRKTGPLPTLVFAHDQPEAVARHFINPNGRHDINATDRFENILTDTCSVKGFKERPEREYQQLTAFLEAHPAVKAWFHGHENYTQFYRWKGTDGRLNLPVFRVDSPMKGEVSSHDDTRLAFLVVTINTATMQLTAREYLWNAGDRPASGRWGESCTISLR